jgi:hypothetical protein
LWRIDANRAGSMLMIKVENRSPEPDGNHRHFLFRLDPELRLVPRGGFGIGSAQCPRPPSASAGREYAPRIET